MSILKESVSYVVILFFVTLTATPLFSASGDPRRIDVSVQPLRPGDHRAAVTKATTVIEAPPKDVIRVLVDDLGQWGTFFPGLLHIQEVSAAKVKEVLAAGSPSYKEVLKMVERDVMSTEPKRARFYLYYLDYPWPLGNRWIVCREVDDRSLPSYAFHREYRVIAGQLVKADGEWFVKKHPENAGWSIITYINLIGDAGF